MANHASKGSRVVEDVSSVDFYEHRAGYYSYNSSSVSCIVPTQYGLINAYLTVHSS